LHIPAQPKQLHIAQRQKAASQANRDAFQDEADDFQVDKLLRQGHIMPGHLSVSCGELLAPDACRLRASFRENLPVRRLSQIEICSTSVHSITVQMDELWYLINHSVRDLAER